MDGALKDRVIGGCPASLADAKGAVNRQLLSGTAANDRARALHVEGAKLYQEGKYDQVYVAFVAACAKRTREDTVKPEKIRVLER